MRELAFYSKLLIFIFFLSGCSTLNYIIEQSQGQYGLLKSTKSFDKVESLDTQKKIKLVQEVKDFSFEYLKLKKSKNYSSFVQLNDSYVTYVVTASEKNKIQAYTWSFPIVGTVPYKGFFKKEKAEKEVSVLKNKNLDVLLRGVRAYSTLGWFKDPLLSSMTEMNNEELAETIIHELTHSTYFKNNDTDFNERLATFVGEKGVELFYKIKKPDQTGVLKKLMDQKYDSKLFHEFMKQEIRKIEDFYSKNGTKSDFETLRESKFNELKAAFKKFILPKLKTDIYRKFQDSKINNAVLLNYKLYYNDLSYFENLFEKSNKDWDLFFKSLKP
ncbi:MAG: aminopeptidase [Oligoflexia bacterium]|nr:aminopeptidase [Oligoflexia bacterium]